MLQDSLKTPNTAKAIERVVLFLKKSDSAIIPQGITFTTLCKTESFQKVTTSFIGSQYFIAISMTSIPAKNGYHALFLRILLALFIFSVTPFSFPHIWILILSFSFFSLTIILSIKFFLCHSFYNFFSIFIL